MAITYHPRPGAILVCDYGTGFVPPEMVKRRLCVVITPRLRRRDGLCAVVPLSTTAPEPPQAYHVELELARELPRWSGRRKWAKCDMISTVGFARLSQIWIGRGPDGRRRYIAPEVTAEQLRAIRAGVLHGLALGELTPHL